jgi:hypothetical protein
MSSVLYYIQYVLIACIIADVGLAVYSSVRGLIELSSQGFGIAIVLGLIFGFLLYLLINVRNYRGYVKDLYVHMEELCEIYTSSIFEIESLDDTGNINSVVSLLRKADPNLDDALKDFPDALKTDFELKGKKTTVRADVVVTIPWESRWRKKLGSKYMQIWIAFVAKGGTEVSLDDIKLFHEKLTDVLPFLNPEYARIFYFSRKGFSAQAIQFVENEDNWIPYWDIGTEDEAAAEINLVNIEPDGRLSVAAMPWLNILRNERLEAKVTDG